MAGTGTVAQFGAYIETETLDEAIASAGAYLETITRSQQVSQFGVYFELDFDTEYPRVSTDGETSIIFNPFIVK